MKLKLTLSTLSFYFVGKDVDKMWNDIYRAIAEVIADYCGSPGGGGYPYCGLYG